LGNHYKFRTEKTGHYLLWAGSIPEDILLEPHQSYFGSIATHYFIGKSDPYYSTDRSGEIEQLLKQAGMKTQLQWFDGEHKIVDSVLQQWAKKYLLNG